MLSFQVRGLMGALSLSVSFGKCVNRLVISFTVKVKTANITADELSSYHQANHPKLSPLTLGYSKKLAL